MIRLILSITALVLLALSAPSGANSSMNFGGVGIDGIPLADGRIAVKQLVIGGPAQLAGIRNGDVITHVDSKPTMGSDFRDILEHRLRGRAGTKVLLTIERPGRKKPLHFTLTRRQLVVGK